VAVERESFVRASHKKHVSGGRIRARILPPLPLSDPTQLFTWPARHSGDRLQTSIGPKRAPSISGGG